MDCAPAPCPLALCVGMAAAVDILQTTEGTKEHSRISEQRDLFIRLFHNSGIPVALNGPAGQWRHPGNANLRFSGFAAEDILGSVQPQLAASTGAACASGIPEPSHVLRAMGLSNAEASSLNPFQLRQIHHHQRSRRSCPTDHPQSRISPGKR